MTRRILLPLTGLWCVLALACASRAEPAPKLAPKYQLELEVRKEENPRTVAVETYSDKTAGRLYFVTPDHKALAVASSAEPKLAETVRPKWTRRFDLPVRGWDQKEFTKDTPKVLVEVFQDATPKRLVYVSESGSLVVLPQQLMEGGAKIAAPRWLYRLQLKIRPSGENDFTRAALKLNVEVYLHEPTGHLIYVGHNGALAVVESPKDFRGLKAKPATWSHALELKARKPNQDGFDRDTPKIGIEVYPDDNAGVTLYATDALTLAAAPTVATELPEKILPPVWKYQLDRGRFAAEVFENPNTGHTVIATHAGALVVLPRP